MKEPSDAKAALISALAARGASITSKQIDRWRADKLIPPARKISKGRGRGVQRPAPEGSAEQILRLQQLLAEDRSVDRAAFRLWIEDFAVPLTRVRGALFALTPDRSRLSALSPERLSDVAEKYSEKMRADKATPARVKEMADDGRLPTFLATMLGMGIGKEIDLGSFPEFAEQFEQYGGLDRARFDHWEGKSPWLTGDTTPQMGILTKVLPAMQPTLIHEATEVEYDRARRAFRSWEKMRRCAELLEALHGPNVFGLSMVTKAPVGASISMLEPALFLGMLGFGRIDSSLLDNMINTGEIFENSLALLRDQVNHTIKNRIEN